MRIPATLAIAFALQGAGPVADPDELARSLFPDREGMHTLRLRDLAEYMKLREGSTVADVGCGSGEIALVLSRAVGPAGRVYAEDISKDQVAAARKLMKKHRAKNVTVLRGTGKDPLLPPASLDAILLMDVYHELMEYPDMLARMRSALKPGGRLTIVDPLPRKTGNRDREIQMKNHVLHPDLAEKDLRAHGFRIVHREDRFLDSPDEEGVQWLLVAEAQ